MLAQLLAVIVRVLVGRKLKLASLDLRGILVSTDYCVVVFFVFLQLK